MFHAFPERSIIRLLFGASLLKKLGCCSRLAVVVTTRFLLVAFASLLHLEAGPVHVSSKPFFFLGPLRQLLSSSFDHPWILILVALSPLMHPLLTSFARQNCRSAPKWLIRAVLMLRWLHAINIARDCVGHLLCMPT